jgi:hypothetical protein
MSERIKPVIIVEPGAMAKKDIAKMDKAGITVVEAKNPQNIRFLDPPPCDRNDYERACIKLSRFLLTAGAINTQYSRYNISEFFVKALLDGIPMEQQTVQPVTPVQSTTKR